MTSLKNKAAIVGIGISPFSRNSGKTELRMTCETIKDALKDAGLTPRDVDGMIKHTDDSSDEHAVTSSMGMPNLTYFGETRWNGAPCGMVMRAAIGVAAGSCHTVVIYRAVNGGSKMRSVPSMRTSGQMSTSDLLHWTFHAPFGLPFEAGSLAMMTRKYMEEFSIDRDGFQDIVSVCRENGSTNPDSFFYQQKITQDDYKASEMVIDPLRRLDIREEMDCAAAFVVTTLERARDLRQTPVAILGAAQGTMPDTESMAGLYREDITEMPEIAAMGRRLYEMADVGPGDIDVAQLDDTYSPLVPIQLEEMGFCKKGEGPAFCQGGDRIRLKGEIPVNTAGGSLGEGHIHNMNHVIEAVRQIRGTSVNQVKDAKLGLVVSGAGGPAGGLILGR